jgi:UDP-GlcNAc:undecaprenyl-phosphate GlcNAc-1-phosphate transferase
MDGLLALILTTLARSSFRLLDTWRHAAESAGAPVVIYGSGRFGELLVREMINNPALGLRPVGFVDDDPVRHGRLVHGLPVFGPMEALRHVMKQRPDLKLVLGIKDIPQERLLKVQQTCSHYGVELLRLRMELEPVGWLRSAAPERSA